MTKSEAKTGKKKSAPKLPAQVDAAIAAAESKQAVNLVVLDLRKGAAVAPGTPQPLNSTRPVESPGIHTIVIDPGHGGKEVGAIMVRSGGILPFWTDCTSISIAFPVFAGTTTVAASNPLRLQALRLQHRDYFR